MNGVYFMAQTNQMLGNNVMNPQQQQQKWMDKPIGDPSGLAYLRPLESLVAKQIVSLTECSTYPDCDSKQKKIFSSFLSQ